MIIGDLAHNAVTVAVYIAAAFLFVFSVMIKVLGFKGTFRRRRPRKERTREG